MAEPRFSNAATLDADDDLPRTLRRERDAQARRAREQELSDAPGAAPAAFTPDVAAPQFEPPPYEFEDAAAPPATIKRLDIPFLHLMFFFLKAVIAGIPALLLLLGLLWLIGEVVTQTFPELIKMQILIRMPN